MYSYKINNSYTVYVNWYYINEARKKSKKSSSHSVKTNSSNNKVERSNVRKSVSPLPNGTRLNNKAYGEGILVSTDDSGIITVLFKNKSAKFIYPDAIYQGFLERV